MKKITLNNFLLASCIAAIVLFNSCESKPFDGVNAILTNVKIDHSVRLQILDANPAASNPYPANTSLTLSGPAVEKGLLYSDKGTQLNSTEGSAVILNGAVTIAVKPFTVIDKSSPLKFTIKAEADNYIANTKEVTITSVDSIQFINIGLLKITSLPVGVSTQTKTLPNVTNGTLPSNFVVTVLSNDGTTNAKTKVAEATFPANTVLKDVNNIPVTSTGNLQVSITNFSPTSTSAPSTTSIPGGTTGITQNNTAVTFVVASAVDINATLGNVAIKEFSNPIPFILTIPSLIYNPSTGTTVKVGDQLPLWSKNEGSVIWNREGIVTLERNTTTGQLFATVMVSHLSQWMVASPLENCSSPVQLKYTSLDKNDVTVFIKVNIKGGNNQLITSKIVSVSDGSTIDFTLPRGINYTFTLFAGASETGALITTIELPSCATTGTLVNTVTNLNPTLFFDLETKCKEGTFRYTGPLEYKLSSSKLWEPFTPSNLGKLTTTLLEWDKTYDFRIVYKSVEYKRRKTVLQSEFRQNGSVWEFWGQTDVKQTFFSTPTSCN